MTAPLVDQWLRLDLDGKTYLVYGYLDRTAGWSAKGVEVQGKPTAQDCHNAQNTPTVTFRMPMGNFAPLPAGEPEAYGLARPSWMRFFEAPAEAVWRTDPRLAKARHPEFPDDVQAMFFLQFPALEQMWVRIEAAVGNAYEGRLLNQPHAGGLQKDARVRIACPPGSTLPIWASPTVEANQQRYRGACAQCGFDWVVVPVDQLIQQQFPDAPPGAQLMSFTTRCALCQGTQVLSAV